MQEPRSTSDVPPKDRLEYWHSLVREVFADLNFRCENDCKENFSGDISNLSSGNLGIFELSTAAHKVHRGKQCGTPSAILLTYQLEGTGYVMQDGHTGILRPGDFTLFDSSRPFDLQFKDPIKQCILRIPWSSVKQHLISPQRITGTRISGTQGAGRIASSFIHSFVSEASQLQAAEVDRLTHCLIDIVNSAVLSHIEPSARQASDYCAFQVHRIRLFIEENLRNPDLSPSLIAAANGISQRYLNKLFEAEGISVSRLIWERRLDRCHHELEDPILNGKSITEIAFAWGFKSSSHFSRTFKDRFGLTPRAVRLKAE